MELQCVCVAVKRVGENIWTRKSKSWERKSSTSVNMRTLRYKQMQSLSCIWRTRSKHCSMQIIKLISNFSQASWIKYCHASSKDNESGIYLEIIGTLSMGNSRALFRAQQDPTANCASCAWVVKLSSKENWNTRKEIG